MHVVWRYEWEELGVKGYVRVWLVSSSVVLTSALWYI